MKIHVLISFIILFTLIACRSNKNLNKVSEFESQTESIVSSQSKDSTGITTNTRDSISNTTTEKQYIRTTWYRPDGTIQKIQEEGRDTRQEGLAVRHTGSSAISLTEQKADSTQKTTVKENETEQLQSTTDSRLIQGSDWLWIGIFVSIALFCTFILIKIKR
ncbi:hypothetical protein JGH11_04635 [Dysgonomonas sp. Marseille-P4677]|uniref:hypothetical protein n=1 Tax=Dysgonomonas sp. Marseille-P4677 TaxID=2364790 RepID=UPI001914BB51|nr:hypothetical protein [Dysgonomonas sp. Marseille-P4677]MBK5720154.1 hypothetical protein [Dysgonomonas sp. Marseille-P4677]